MNYDMTVAIELPRVPSCPFAAAAEPTSRIRRRWTRMRNRTEYRLADWEPPLERFDRLHAELRYPLGHF